MMIEHYRPTRKIRNVGLGGAVSVVVIALLNAFLSDPIDAELASAVTAIVTAVVGYWTDDDG